MSVWTAPGPGAPAGPEPAERSGWAAAVLEQHGQLSGLGPYEADGTDGVVHLLTDLMHLTCDRDGDFGLLVRSAQRHFAEERLQPALPRTALSRTA